MSSPSSQSILLVEDDATVSDVVTRYLEREGFDVESVADGHLALDKALASAPDLIVLDLMLPGMNGLEVCRRIRQRSPVPIIMLTARGQESDRVTGLELGADDYITKPFSPRELTARVKTVLRRVPVAPSGAPRLDAVPAGGGLCAGDITVDVAAREVHVDSAIVSLTVREFDLLVFLMAHPRRVFRRDELLDHVWGYTYGDTSTVTVHVRRLREKIERDPGHPLHIQTVWGVGYRFEA